MQRAVFLSRLHGVLPQGYTRLYFGSEFCCWSFPAIAHIEEALNAAHRAGLHFTLATPVLNEGFLPQLRAVFARLGPQLKAGDEILISDWGALGAARELCPHITLILGRVLSGQKRGPQILELDLPAAARDYFCRGTWYGGEGQALLAELGIARIELDNLLQGVAALPPCLHGSLHYPYVFVTSTRSCPWRAAGSSGPCAAPCGEVFALTSEREPLPLLQGGNTQFFEHAALPDDLPALGVDRLIYHPRLPR